MWEDFSKYSNKDFFKFIDNLPNESLDSNNIVKEILIDNYSILISYGLNVASNPKTLLRKISLYEKIAISLYKLNDDIRTSIYSFNFVFEKNEERNFINSLSTENRILLNGAINNNGVEKDDYNMVFKKFIDLNSLFIILRYLSKFCKLRIIL